MPQQLAVVPVQQHHPPQYHGRHVPLNPLWILSGHEIVLIDPNSCAIILFATNISAVICRYQHKKICTLCNNMVEIITSGNLRIVLFTW